MISTSPQPRSTTYRPRRAFLLSAACGLLSAILVAPAPAWGQGLIDFNVGLSSFTEYRVGADGTGLGPLSGFPQMSFPYMVASAQNYPEVGRLYLYGVWAGNTPTGSVYSNVMAWCEATGQSKAVTNINGPLYGRSSGAVRWSNDDQDSFVSFVLYDPHGSQNYTCRAHVSAADIASPDFQPITNLDDPRLELVVAEGNFCWWGHDGSRFYYVDPNDTSKIRVKVVGGVDMLAFQAPVGLGDFRVGPVVDALNPDRYFVATAIYASTRSGTQSGILAIDLVTGTCQWLATPTSTGLSQVRGAVFSQDGSTVAFGGVRSATTAKPKKTTYYAGVYTVPFFGGPVTRVTEVSTAGGNVYATVNAWNLP